MHREVMQRRDRNAVILGDIGDHPVVGLARRQQIGAVGQLGQRPAHLGPPLDEQFLARLGEIERILRLGQIVGERRNLVDLDPGVRSVCHAGQARRLDEADQVGRQRHPHAMPAPQQLHADRCARFDVTPGAMHRQDEFHRTSGGGQLVVQQIGQATHRRVDVGRGDAHPVSASSRVRNSWLLSESSPYSVSIRSTSMVRRRIRPICSDTMRRNRAGHSSCGSRSSSVRNLLLPACLAVLRNASANGLCWAKALSHGNR